MQYAFLQGTKSEAAKGQRATCIGCGQPVIAKCGNVKIHHWAHVKSATCDSWWENETTWHREWKGFFPAEYREINFFDETMREYHRADIFNAAGVTIEFQNSHLNHEELIARERFYPKLIWVVNGLKFKGFKVLKALPNVNDARLSGFEFRKSDHLSVITTEEALAQHPRPQILNFYHLLLKEIPLTTDFYSFSWKYPHQAWLSATCPVFIDFGGHFIYRLRVRYQISTNYPYLQMFRKKDFIQKYQ
ncbi:competence protein CoiA [Pedobacter sandarakinus]|uniref:competence protein CoiA n=1 Tax=Pedobacter sandarakinus TaxID=353156 RepID=UPI0022461351|nr:competence protein CoiA family protein [Pedobacter sandarakinus]MCX2574942.1 competence protein CoiA family protein [Pedobacter sandarakinus]